jgi:dihydroneopterin aldolase
MSDPRDDSPADVHADADAILVEGVEVPAALGVTSAERRMRRPVRIDLELGFDLRPAGRSDRVKDTIDYADVYRVVERIAGSGEHRLVEALGERVVTALLEELPVDWVRIRVRKPKPVAGVLEHAGVRITRRRGD